MNDSEKTNRIAPAAQALGLTSDELLAKLNDMGATNVDILDDDEVFKFGDSVYITATTCCWGV